jgi:hypothetical protein
MIRPAAALLLALTVAAPAVAADKKPKAAPGAPSQADGFDLSPVAVPVIVGGQVRNYVFVTLKVVPTAKADLSELRKKEPFFRDAFVRAAHRSPLTRADNYNLIDEGKAVAVMMAAAPGVAGPGQVKAVKVAEQLPKNMVRMPRAPAGAPVHK